MGAVKEAGSFLLWLGTVINFLWGGSKAFAGLVLCRDDEGSNEKVKEVGLFKKELVWSRMLWGNVTKGRGFMHGFRCIQYETVF